MTDLLRIAGISDDEVARLRAIDICTIEALWTRLDEVGIRTVAFQADLTAEGLKALLPDRSVGDLPGRPPVPVGATRRRRPKTPTLDDLWGRLDASGLDMIAEETGIGGDRLLELATERERREAVHREMLSTRGVATLLNITPEAVVALAGGGATTVKDLWSRIRTAGCGQLAQATGLAAERLRAFLTHDAARAVADRLPDASVPIERFENVTAEEARNLRKAGIGTVGEIRAQLAESGIERLARESGRGERDLLEIFSGQAVREAEGGNSSPISRVWLPGLIVGGALVVLALVVRSTGIFGSLAAPIGGLHAVVVPKADLAAGVTVTAADFAIAALPCAAQCFRSVDEIEGLKLTRPVRAGKAVRHGDTARLQVTAARDLPAHTRMAADAVSLTWTPYEPDAIVRLDNVVGRSASYAIRVGEVLHATAVDAWRTLAKQVAVKRPAGLPAFEVIGPNDVELRDGPPEVGSFDTTERVVGRFSLQAIPAGMTLRAEHLGSPRIDLAALKDRRLLRAPILTSGLSALVQPGDRVSLRLARGARPVLVRNAILVAMELERAGATAVVAVSAADVAKLAAVPGPPSLFVVWPES